MNGNGLWPVRLLVLDRGFVLAARCPEPTEYALWLPLTHSRVVRRWGTTRGLAELCGGPTAETVLDEVCESETVPVRAVLRVLEVEQEPWARHLTPPSSAGATRRRAPSS